MKLFSKTHMSHIQNHNNCFPAQYENIYCMLIDIDENTINKLLSRYEDLFFNDKLIINSAEIDFPNIEVHYFGLDQDIENLVSEDVRDKFVDFNVVKVNENFRLNSSISSGKSVLVMNAFCVYWKVSIVDVSGVLIHTSSSITIDELKAFGQK